MWGLHQLFNRTKFQLERLADDQFNHICNTPFHYVPAAILLASGLSLFLELSLIRWHSTIFEFFAFYKNYTLLSCFAGLGLGYALAGKKQLPLLWSPGLLFLQIGMFLVLRHGLHPLGLPLGIPMDALNVTPIIEQANMGFGSATTIPHFIAICFFLGLTFLLICLTMLPVGQLCGILLHRVTPLKGYGLILMGSILGVGLSILLSYLWTPPAVWFGLVGVGLMIFLSSHYYAQLLGGCLALGILILLVWPVHFPWYPIYSPYQLLEHGPGKRGQVTIRAEGHFFQNAHDLSESSVYRKEDGETAATGHYYDFPYMLIDTPRSVAIVGAGSGNDVAAALRAGVDTIDAVEIDPAIYQIGAYYHPEAPYSNPRVKVSINDARSFFRQGTGFYEMIIYGLLDSHILLSQASNLRIDSYVYTMEGLQEARKRLTNDGTMCLTFAMISEVLGRKLYLMMEQVFDGRPPICIRSGYDGGVIFIQHNDDQINIDPGLLETTGFTDVTSVYRNAPVLVDLPTDDWPFFYMAVRTYPLSYMLLFLLMAAATAILLKRFDIWRPATGSKAFFLLGAGFMLVETKGITEMGLQFGNTWQVIGITIVGVLIMSFLANFLVACVRINRIWPSGTLLLTSVLGGLLIAMQGAPTATFTGKLTAVVLLTCPVFFGGIIFSVLLRKHGGPSKAMSFNLLGAMTGGMLEYHAMVFGFQSLYWFAIGLYGLAVIAAWRSAYSFSE